MSTPTSSRAPTTRPSSAASILRQIITDGEDEGTHFTWEQGIESPLRDGDEILVTAVDTGDGTTTYEFWDYQRSTPMLVLVGLFVVAVLVPAGGEASVRSPV